MTTDTSACASCPPTDPRVVRSRNKILRAATELLVESGPRSVTVDAVVERSGVAKTTLYRHWPSREALLVDVMRSNVPQVDPPDADAPFELRLRTLVQRVTETLSAPDWRAMMPALLSLKQQVPELREISDEDSAEKLALLGSILEQGADEGHLPAHIDTRSASAMLVGPVLFAVLFDQVDERDELAELADDSVDRFLAWYRADGDAADE